MTTLWAPGRTLDDMEKETVLEALKFYQGNKTKTASSLGISIRGLDGKLERYAGKKEGTETDPSEAQRLGTTGKANLKTVSR